MKPDEARIQSENERGAVRDEARRSREAVDAAAAAFAESGYHGASTRVIAERLGIRQASVYYYMRSKEAALERVCTVAIEDLLDGARGLVDAELTASQKLLRLAQRHLVTMIDSPDYARVFLTQRRFLSGAPRERIRDLEREYERIVETLIVEGVDHGEFRADLPSRDLMLATLALCNAGNLWQASVDGMSLDRALRLVSTLLIDGMSAAHAARAGVAVPADRRAPEPPPSPAGP